MHSTVGSFWDKTMQIMRDIWPLGDPNELKDTIRPNLPQSDITVVRQVIDRCLDEKGGEVSARSRAAELGRAYLILNARGRRRFLELLANDYGVDNVAIEKAIEERSGIKTPYELQEANHKLQNLLEPPRTKLLAHFNELQNGVKFLVDLRAELMPLTRKNKTLKALDRSMFRLLVSWFDIGFLNLRRITWQTPAAILEKLIKYEAVHAISSWTDMKNRLRDDRRCYGFFHPSMPDEPLIFVEVALVNGLADNIQDLLDVNAEILDPEKADTAIFYSISNCQKGLAGVSFGNFLIKRVVTDLTTKYPNLKTFSTLSPIPGFIPWLISQKDSLELSEKDKDSVLRITNAEDPTSFLQKIVSAEDSQEKEKTDYKNLLLKLCADYLLSVKLGEQAFDRVTHFHLSNGAQIERINWGGNVTSTGIEQSASIMVNYLYKLSQIEENHELYRGKGVIAASSLVKKLI